ncbi:Tetratricopeptide repeat-containing protein [Actinomadura meyerae]|jgi:predicted Zn-dependent protease|uniref:Tetratricopeptide repeat-containing protein n=1 Tax=Actinomadura meyerae TaxID=240840 RepID=A0A239P0B1_9ACTN|nr:tetratricopeptide repeat protein [Actinomadura meyerae]SNT60561.1 Tetratricopeptide repeat-containing protein [Actinomadura meyerae]
MSGQGPGRPEDSPGGHPGADRGAEAGGDPGEHAASPGGGVYEWYTRGLELLRAGSAAAALQLLTRAAEAEPGSHSIREALGRAQFGARQFDAAAESFRGIVEAEPAEDYARFGLGLALSRLGDFAGAVEQLALAAAMRPDNPDYARALRQARATLDARR